MACSKIFLLLLLINVFSNFNPCLCDGSDAASSLDQLLPSLGQSAVLMSAQCVQKLTPCQSYLKSPINVPPTCCDPLNELVANSSECLCNIINNPKLIISFDVTKDDILKLPAACGIHVDASKCDEVAEGTSPSPSSQADDETAVEDATSEETTSSSSTKMNTPFGITYFGVPGFVAALTTLVFSAY